MAAIAFVLTSLLSAPAFAQTEPAHPSCYPPPCAVVAGGGAATGPVAPTPARATAVPTTRTPAAVVALGLVMLMVVFTGICLRRRTELAGRRPPAPAPSVPGHGDGVAVRSTNSGERLTSGARTP